jgi:protocatechuate 3,4-dioxygenase beta subunit
MKKPLPRTTQARIAIGVISITLFVGAVTYATTGSEQPANLASSISCAPTPTDALGPYYVPGAPELASTGDGSLDISGTIRSWPDCLPVPGAKIEFWQAGNDGQYTDDQRSTVYADDSGTFIYSSGFPGRYEARPIHIHVKITAAGITELVTQIYPEDQPRDSELRLVFTAVADNATPPAGYSTRAPQRPLQ